MDTNKFGQPFLTEEEKEFLRSEIKKADKEIKEILKKECFTNLSAAADAQDEKCKTIYGGQDSHEGKGVNGKEKD